MKTFVSFIEEIRDTKDYGVLFRDYFDAVQKGSAPDDAFLVEPDWGSLTKREVSYITACVHYTCNKIGAVVPDWVHKDQYFLEEPYFAMSARGPLRILLIQESPREFRSRNIFVPHNVLGRV